MSSGMEYQKKNVDLTPGRKESIIINGTSIEAPGLGNPEDLGAPTAPLRVRFSYDRRMGDTRNGVPALRSTGRPTPVRLSPRPWKGMRQARPLV